MVGARFELRGRLVPRAGRPCHQRCPSASGAARRASPQIARFASPRETSPRASTQVPKARLRSRPPSPASGLPVMNPRDTAPPAPPVAKRIPKATTIHGDTLVDDYAWMRDRDDPDVRRYLEAENAY